MLLRNLSAVALFIACTGLSRITFAQTPGTGFPPFSSVQSGEFDSVNLQNLDFGFVIPVVSHSGRGMGFHFGLSYVSPSWVKTTSGGTTSWGFGDGWSTAGPVGSINDQKSTIVIGSCTITMQDWTYIDPSGTTHAFPVTRNSGCNAPPSILAGYALDASGFFMDITNQPAVLVRAPDGTTLNFATTSTFDSNGNLITQNPTIIDPNGNEITSVSCSPTNDSNPPCVTETDWTDTLGQKVLKITSQGNGPNGLISETDYARLAVDGSYQTVALKYEFVSAKSNFGCSGVSEFQSGASGARLVSEIDLPNGQKYTFLYEQTPGFPGNVTGRIQQITLPTGGTVTYSYTGPNGGISCSDGSLLSFTRTVSDGTTSGTWTYSRTPNNSGGTTTITAPQLPYDSAGNQTVITFDPTLGFETSRKIYQGAATGTPLRAINTTWTNNNSGFNNTPLTQTTILEDGSTQSEVETTYDTNGLLQVTKEHDWGSGAPGPVLRTTNLYYLNSTAYIAANIINKVNLQTVTDSTGTVKSRTSISYDDSGFANSSCPANIPQHDDTHYGCSYFTRGLPTKVTTYTDAATPAGGVTKTFSYDWFGNLISAQLNCCQQKQWNFSSTTQYAFPDSVVSGTTGGTQLTTSATYNVTTGQTATSTDENLQQTTFTYSDPGHMDRLTDVKRPDGTHGTTAFNDVQNTITSTTPVQGTNLIKKISALDGLGRLLTTTIEDASNNVYSITKTQYDPMGRPFTTSNPYTSSPQFFTTQHFDAVGRPTETQLPDGAQTSVNYATNSATVSDPAGKQRRSFSDGLGRLIEVDEPGDASAGAQAQGTITISGTLGSKQGVPAASGSGSFTIKGSENFQIICRPLPCKNVYDTGNLSVTINIPGNTVTETVSYGNGSTAQNLATALANQFSATGLFTIVSAIDTTGSDGIPAYTATLAAVATGSATNYPYSATQSGVHNDFTATTAGSSFTGGVDGQNGATDFGTITATIGSFTTPPVCYGTSCNSTSGAVASALATALGASGSPVGQISVTGSTITMTANQPSTAWNVTITATPASGDPADFPGGSFASSGSLGGGADPHPSELKYPYITTYSYGVRDNLLQVTQGVQTRVYGYDDMGRLTDVTTPEAGHVNYQYNSFDLLTQRTDARGVQTNYQYDGLNRLIGFGYTIPTGSQVAATPNVCTPSGGVPANVCYSYGTSAGQNNNGRLLTVTDPLGSETYSYDILGRATQVQKNINGTAYPTAYSYNLAGELIQITYPSGRIVQQSFDAIGRLCEIAPQTTGCGSSATPYATAFSYNTAAQLTGFNYGNGVNATFNYSPDRLQMTGLSYIKGTQTLFGLNYFYHQDSTNCPQAGLGNNGQVQCITDVADSGRSVTYTYDTLGRLLAAGTQGSTNYPAWGLSFSYDRYGNRLAQNVTAGSATPNSAPTDPATNHINNGVYSYDASGDMTYDGNNTLIYDAASRVVSSTQSSVASVYSYDCKNLRVVRSSNGTTTVYIYSGNKVIAEYQNGAAPNAPAREYIYSGSGLLAKIEGGVTNYYHADHLSTRVTTDVGGSAIGQQALYPFGDSWYDSGTTSTRKLGDYQRDLFPDSGNDYALERSYVDRVGRFLTADPLQGSVVRPQTLNRYTYVANDPINARDPSGMFILAIDRFLDPAGFGSNGFFGNNLNELTLMMGDIYYDEGWRRSLWGWMVVGDPTKWNFSTARNKAMTILNGNNPCAKFFNQNLLSALNQLLGLPAISGSDALSAANITPDLKGAFQITRSTDSNGSYTYSQPYAAGTKQWAGLGADITVNANGAFFNSSANVKGTSDFRPLTIGGTDNPYEFSGNSVEAQITILLHELAHDLGLIPRDANNPDQSVQNTKTILDNCRSAIKSAAK